MGNDKLEKIIEELRINREQLLSEISMMQSNWNILKKWLKGLIDNFQEDVSTPILHEQMTIKLVYEYMEGLEKMNELERKDDDLSTK